MMRLETDIKLTSPNVKRHHMSEYSKNKKNKYILKFLLLTQRDEVPKLPVHVRLTRHCKRKYDWDNYISACKPIRDCIADFLIPGKAPGQADSSLDIFWHYEQDKQLDKKDKLVIEIF